MTFEEKLQKLEELTSTIKNPEITLEKALSTFEEGIKLAKGMEKEIEEIEGKVQILMTSSAALDEAINNADSSDTESAAKPQKKRSAKKAKSEEIDDSNIIYDKSSLEFEMFNAPELNS